MNIVLGINLSKESLLQKPRINDNVVLHGKGELELYMELKLLISLFKIGRSSWIIWVDPM